MPVSKAQQKAVNKYMAANYDRVNLTMPKGKKGMIQAHAEAHNESVNGFINRAINETMERDKHIGEKLEPWQCTRAAKNEGSLYGLEQNVSDGSAKGIKAFDNLFICAII